SSKRLDRRASPSRWAGLLETRMNTASPPAVQVRVATSQDLDGIYACQAAAYANFGAGGLCDHRQLGLQIDAFPEGQLVAVLADPDAPGGERIVGYAMALIVSLDEDSPWYSYAEITGDATFSTHDPAGDTLYGADIAVDPDHRGRGVASALYVARRELLARFNLWRMVAGGRIPGYAAVAGRMSA